jgi:threonine dehydrogenase-like Zn-dependent dehydrogenase
MTLSDYRVLHLGIAANTNALKVPDDMSDEQVVLLSDILPTAWHANELAEVGDGDNVAIWGAGPGVF